MTRDEPTDLREPGTGTPEYRAILLRRLQERVDAFPFVMLLVVAPLVLAFRGLVRLTQRERQILEDRDSLLSMQKLAVDELLAVGGTSFLVVVLVPVLLFAAVMLLNR